MRNETVGSLLALIAGSINDAIRILTFADKRGWGRDEHEQLRLLEDLLDDAKKDFQELPALVNGQFYYESDRKPDTLQELDYLRHRFDAYTQNFREWARIGGPINPTWAVDTLTLRQDLHRAQCRAVNRIYDSQVETATRCLGAMHVYRAQRAPPSHHEPITAELQRTADELAACNIVGRFERFADRDIAYVCDFCDGYLVWEDLEAMPSMRMHSSAASDPVALSNIAPDSAIPFSAIEPDDPVAAVERRLMSATSFAVPTTAPPGSSSSMLSQQDETHNWQASGMPSSASPLTQEELPQDLPISNFDSHGPSSNTREGAEPKTIVFAPVAIANHRAPGPGAWRSPILCPYCDDHTWEEQGPGGTETKRWAQDEVGFQDIKEFQEHLEWEHAPSMLPKRASNCIIM